MKTAVAVKTCYHCGDACNEILTFDNKEFCCTGCKTVYELLSSKSLHHYYELNNTPGTGQKKAAAVSGTYAFLDDEQVKAKLVSFTQADISKVTFSIPNIHCSSCIFVLENLHKLQEGVLKCHVNFLRRQATITFNNCKVTLRSIVETLDAIGYAPSMSLDMLDEAKPADALRSYYLKIGIAFFCFGNIMLLSFPEYLGIDALAESPLRHFFGYLNFLLSLPVMFYCSQEFFISAHTALRQRSLNMDIPIVLGIITMFLRSSYEVFSQTGAGYFDTLGSLILLMLVGRFFQNRTYATLSFERDYKSYFPVSVTVVDKGVENTVPLTHLKPGDRLIVRNKELIPADTILIKGNAAIDYSFVTGEANPVAKHSGDLIYAGGRQTGSAIELEVTRDVSHSYLTQLWNDSAFHKKERKGVATVAVKASRWFTPMVILIAAVAGIFWMGTDIRLAINAFTSVLIITCPCALALSSPFTMGNVLRILGKNGVYLKNGEVVEKLAAINTIVFDKTGTLTNTAASAVSYTGTALSRYDLKLIRSLAYHSSHPLSRRLYNVLQNTECFYADSFKETEGAGIEGWIDENHVRIGSQKFIYKNSNAIVHEPGLRHASNIYVAINNQVKGCYKIINEYRPGLEGLLKTLSTRLALYVASGDNDDEKRYLQQFVPGQNLVFKQQPADKLNFIKQLQQRGETVMMVGDGLNDAGALQQANVGLAISDNVNNFVPACDIIADSAQFTTLPALLLYARKAVQIIRASFAISLLYNVAGIYLAVQGTMSPVVAAVLMPVSSVTIILFTTLASGIAAKKYGFGLSHPANKPVM